MGLDALPRGFDPRPENVCGRCGNPLPLMGGMRRCPAPPRDRDDGNLCYKAPADPDRGSS